MTQPSTCNRDDSESEGQADALSVQLAITAHATPTPLWAVVWGPTQPLEDETHHFLSSQETDQLHQRGSHQAASTGTTAEAWLYPGSAAGSTQPREEPVLEARDLEDVKDGGSEAEEREPEEGGHQGRDMKDL